MNLHLSTLIALLLATVTVAAAEHYPGQFDQISPQDQFFLSNQKRPNMQPWTGAWSHDSCCGPADAYEADEFETGEGNTIIAIITEGDDPTKSSNGERYCQGDNDTDCKPFIPPGTRIVVPPDRIISAGDPPNTTGHGWIWLSGKTPFCYMPPSGV